MSRDLVADAGVTFEGLPHHHMQEAIDTGIPRIVVREALFTDGEGNHRVAKKHRFTVGIDQGKEYPLGAVKDGYKPIQFEEAIRLPRRAVEEFGGKALHGGSIGHGAQFWAQFKIDGDFKVGKAPMDTFMFCYSDNTGAGSLTIKPTTRNAWCSNQFASVLRGRFKALKVSHKGDVEYKLNELELLFEAVMVGLREQRITFDRMFDIPLRPEERETFIWLALGIDPQKKKEEDLTTNTKNKINRVQTLHEVGYTARNLNKTEKSTLWNTFNAITEFTDHHQSYKRTNGMSASEARLRSSLIKGAGVDVKNRAYNLSQSIIQHVDQDGRVVIEEVKLDESNGGRDDFQKLLEK